MAWRWVDTDGAISAEAAASVGLNQGFGDQAGAEAWLTAFYDDLAAAGVASVTLFEEDRPVYGMSLLGD